MKVRLDQIKVGPRQRVDLGDIDSLAESLKNLGQIHSIGLTPDLRLIWGRRRLEAALKLGWTEIEATVREKLTPLQEQLIEFEEDFARKDRTWQEKCLAVYKVNAHYEREHDRGNLAYWSSRALSTVTGMSNMSMNYMLRVAKQLAQEPKDEEVWACDGYYPALQVMLKRQEAAISAELDRRRPPPVDATKLPVGAEVVPPPSGTEAVPNEPEKVLIYVHGKPYAYEDTPVEELAEVTSCVLAYGDCTTESFERTLLKDLRPGGYALIWGDNGLPAGLQYMGFGLIWNQINVSTENPWPFEHNYEVGILSRKGIPTTEVPPSTASISAVIDSDDPTCLPQAVVEFSLRPLCPDGLAVKIPCGVNPVHVAEMGRTPIWFEPDKAKFQKKFEDLKRHYEANIPNVEVRLR